ncbi:MAG: hypothetical protein ABJA67_17805 [Chthonomonadales bacterium]
MTETKTPKATPAPPAGPYANVAFCGIWERTDTWFGACEELRKAGVKVFHILTAQEYVDKAYALGYTHDQVLYLRKDEALAAPFSEEDFDLACEFERRSASKIKHYLAMERFLRAEPWGVSQKYILYIFRKILDFVEKNDIQLVSGEPSTMHDLVALLICHATGRHYSAPFDIRFPIQRFVMWEGEGDVVPIITGAKTPEDVEPEFIEMAKEIRERVLNKEKMKYVANRTSAPSIGLPYIKRVVRGVISRATTAKRDANIYTLPLMFTHHKYHMIPINYRLNKLQWNSLFDQPVEGERFVLYTLNYTPEHSVDVLAPYFTDAYEVIKNIARGLPLDVKLYVKEHPNALGIRGPKYLKALKGIPGVKLIDPYINSHDLLNKAEITVSLSGTISLEAALYGKKTVILSDIFIHRFSTCLFTEEPWTIGAMIDMEWPEVDVDNDIRQMAWFLSNTFEGTVVDRITSPEGVAPENLKKVAFGFFTLLRAIADGKVVPKQVPGSTAPIGSAP